MKEKQDTLVFAQKYLQIFKNERNIKTLFLSWFKPHSGIQGKPS